MVDLLQAITFVDANSGDSVALKFASENPIPAPTSNGAVANHNWPSW
jgi:hypothetical protein